MHVARPDAASPIFPKSFEQIHGKCIHASMTVIEWKGRGAGCKVDISSCTPPRPKASPYSLSLPQVRAHHVIWRQNFSRARAWGLMRLINKCYNVGLCTSFFLTQQFRFVLASLLLLPPSYLTSSKSPAEGKSEAMATEQRNSPSPSPPANPPTSSAPGPRVKALRDIFDLSLRHTLDKCTYDNFAECFPTPAKHVPEALSGLHRDFIAKLDQMCRVCLQRLTDEEKPASAPLSCTCSADR